MDATQDGSQDTSQDMAEDASYDALVEALRDQVSYLKALIQTCDRELEARTEKPSRKDHIIAALTERIPELEAPSEPREAPRNTFGRPLGRGRGGIPDDRERVSWWRRLFSPD